MIITVNSSVASFLIGLGADINHLSQIVIGLIIVVFVIIGLFSDDSFKNFIFTSDLYHQRIVKEYRHKLAEKQLNIPE